MGTRVVRVRAEDVERIHQLSRLPGKVPVAVKVHELLARLAASEAALLRLARPDPAGGG